ncbi:hypothetical protein BSKO_12106 [Bryopsis sp. KO-2023]|nr:hypothetical protein BSKO_12106 [Bryopsis sp. KO-2023]
MTEGGAMEECRPSTLPKRVLGQELARTATTPPLADPSTSSSSRGTNGQSDITPVRLRSFQTARSWLSSVSSGSLLPGTNSSDGLLPSVVLMLPPCASVGSVAPVDIHLDHPVPGDVNFEMVGMMKGLLILSQPITSHDGVVIRLNIPPLAVGVVDVFVHKTGSSPSSYAGGPGHLLVLPEAPTRDGNTMFNKLVELALANPAEAGVPGEGLPVEESPMEAVPPPSRSCASFTSEMDLRSADLFTAESDSALHHPEEILEPSPFAIVGQRSDGPFVSPSMLLDIPRPRMVPPPEPSPSRVLDIQKWVWTSSFIPFVLELEAMLQAVANAGEGDASRTSTSIPLRDGGVLEVGPTFMQILENMLKHLRRFNSWELIAYLLRKSSDVGVAIFWGENRLGNEVMGGQRLKELAVTLSSGPLIRQDEEAGAIVCTMERPGPSNRPATRPEIEDVPGSRTYGPVGSVSTIGPGENRVKGHFRRWLRNLTLNRQRGGGVTSASEEPQLPERKGKSRVRKLMRSISNSMKVRAGKGRGKGERRSSTGNFSHQSGNRDAEEMLEGPSTLVLPTIESGQVLDSVAPPGFDPALVEIAPRDDSATHMRSPSAGDKPRRRVGQKAWDSIRRRFFKTDSANTAEQGGAAVKEGQEGRRRTMGQLRKFISSLSRSRQAQDARDRAVAATR